MRSALRAVAAGLVAAHLGGCATHGWRQRLQEYERALELEIRGPSLLRGGKHDHVELQLHNRGDGVLEVCLGLSRQISVIADQRAAEDGRPAVGGSATAVDHSSCQARFTLQPGARWAWSETVAVPQVPPGPALLTVGVEVVSPHHCDRRYGCYSTMVTASTRRLVE